MSKKVNYFYREIWIYVILIGILSLIIGKLFWLQIASASDLKSRGTERRTIDHQVIAKRGTIFDSQNRVLAQSVPAEEVFLDPRTFSKSFKSKESLEDSKNEIASKLGLILGLAPEEILASFNKDVSWVRITRYADLDQVEKVKALNIPGIGFTNVQKRVYPLNSIASQVLGIVNYDGNGAEGLEYRYDQVLFGQQGYTSQALDTGLRSIFQSEGINNKPNEGYNLHLTLDSNIQFVVEQQLDILQEETKADRIAILAMDPMSGKILAMGSRPTFNPNDYISTTPEQRKNLPLSLSYEPGSTFKIITGAAALEEGIVKPDDIFNDPGWLKIGNRTITNWDSDRKSNGDITFTEAMKRSSNVVLAQVGEKLGKERFYQYLKAFGFGENTGIDIAGEETGLIMPINEVRPIDLATMSFGQANLVTPIQLLTAISAVANGGTLYNPYIVERITTNAGDLVKENVPTPVRQVISPKTASQMTEILEQVVLNGTGRLVGIPGIKVAGKTGTAQKVDPKTGSYSKDQYIASFASFAPTDDPKIAILVIIDNPKGESRQGGTIAAPVAKTIIERSLQYLGIPVDKSTNSEVSPLTDSVKTRPSPKPVAPERTPETNEVVVPDFTGLTMREAGNILTELKLRFQFEGTGLVVKQNPLAGKVVKEGSKIELKFSPSEQSIEDFDSRTDVSR